MSLPSESESLLARQDAVDPTLFVGSGRIERRKRLGKLPELGARPTPSSTRNRLRASPRPAPKRIIAWWTRSSIVLPLEAYRPRPNLAVRQLPPIPRTTRAVGHPSCWALLCCWGRLRVRRRGIWLALQRTATGLVRLSPEQCSKLFQSGAKTLCDFPRRIELKSETQLRLLGTASSSSLSLSASVSAVLRSRPRCCSARRCVQSHIAVSRASSSKPGVSGSAKIIDERLARYRGPDLFKVFA